MKTFLILILTSLALPLAADMKKDVKAHERRLEDIEDSLGGIAQELYYIDFYLQQLEQRLHDIELKMELRNGKNCTNAAL